MQIMMRQCGFIPVCILVKQVRLDRAWPKRGQSRVRVPVGLVAMLHLDNWPWAYRAVCDRNLN